QYVAWIRRAPSGVSGKLHWSRAERAMGSTRQQPQLAVQFVDAVSAAATSTDAGIATTPSTSRMTTWPLESVPGGNRKSSCREPGGFPSLPSEVRAEITNGPGMSSVPSEKETLDAVWVFEPCPGRTNAGGAGGKPSFGSSTSTRAIR